MLISVCAVIHDGQIELSEPMDLPEGTKVLVTLLPESDSQFWLGASQMSLDAVWDNAEDDAYAQLLQE